MTGARPTAPGQPPFSYTAYGLGIHSELPLPELEPGNGEADVTIRLGVVDRPAPERTGPGVRHATTGDETLLALDPVGKMVVRGGRELVVDAVPDVGAAVLRTFLLGPGLGTLLIQRGLLVLHASAVDADGGAIVFVGGAGWGKSTTAAALHSHGCPVVADDIVPLELEGARARVLPGFPHLKLWLEVASTLGSDPAEWSRIYPELAKGYQRTEQGFSGRPRPLAAIYLLAEGDELAIEPVGARDAMIELVRHSWAPSLFHALAPREHFDHCTRLARQVPLRRLTRPRRLDLLADLADLVERDARTLSRQDDRS